MRHELIHHLTDQQIIDLVDLYQKEWWTKGRTLADVRKMLANTDIVVAFRDPDTSELLAFSRILTDFVYRAMIYDVIVAERVRKMGYGQKLLIAILEHPALERVEQVQLSCRPELVPFYESLGFQVVDNDSRFLRITRPKE